MTEPPDPNVPPQEQQPSEPPPGQFGAPPPGQFHGPPPDAPPGQYGTPPPGQFGGPPPGQFAGPPPGQYAGPPPGQFAPPFPSAPQYAQAPEVDQQGYVLDYASGLYLPPGTELASIGRRVGAFFLGVLLAIVTLGIGWAIWGLIVWGRGQTPALQVLGMRCWRPMQRDVATWGTMALRQVVGRFLVESLIGLIGIASFIIMLVHPKRQAIHDMIASTVVLYDHNKVLEQQVKR